MEKIVSSCKALVLGNEIIFQIPDADKGCDYLVQGKCPAEPNTDLALRLKVPVKPPSLAVSTLQLLLNMGCRALIDTLISFAEGGH